MNERRTHSSFEVTDRAQANLSEFEKHSVASEMSPAAVLVDRQARRPADGGDFDIDAAEGRESGRAGSPFKAQRVNFWIARAPVRCVSTRTPPLAFARTCDDGISQDLVVPRHTGSSVVPLTEALLNDLQARPGSSFARLLSLSEPLAGKMADAAAANFRKRVPDVSINRPARLGCFARKKHLSARNNARFRIPSSNSASAAFRRRSPLGEKLEYQRRGFL